MTFLLPLCEPQFLHEQYSDDYANWKDCSEDTIKMPSAWIYKNTYPPLGGGSLPQVQWHKDHFPGAFRAGTLFQLLVMSGNTGVHSCASYHASVFPSSTIPFLPILDSSLLLSQSIEELYAQGRWPILSSTWPKAVASRTEYHSWRTPSLTQVQSSDFIFALSWSGCAMYWKSPSFSYVVWIITEIR